MAVLKYDRKETTMSKEEIHVCPKCGAAMVQSQLDGTWTLNGNTDLNEYYCPICSAKSDSDTEDE